jgi:hypothetical protein
MADEINFEVTGFGQLRQQLKEAQLEMIKLAEAGKQGSKEFLAAAQKAGQLKEAIKDASESANVFTTEGKFQAVTKSLAAVSGGFTAIQGAIGLVSDDTKAFEETFKKLQSAMALTQGLTALADLGDAFKNLKSVATNAFNGIKAAIGSTGIGLLIIGLGIAVQQLSSYFNEQAEAEKEAELQAEILNRQLQELKTTYDQLSQSISYNTQQEVIRAQVAGKTEVEIQDIKIKGAKEALAALDVQAQKEKSNLLDRLSQNAMSSASEEDKTKKYHELKEEERKADDAYTKNKAKLQNDLDTLENERPLVVKRANEKIAQNNQDSANKENARKVKALEDQRDFDLAELESKKILDLGLAQTEEEKAIIEDKYLQLSLERQAKFENDREDLRTKEEKSAVALQAKIKDLDNQQAESAQELKDKLKEIADKKVKDAEEARKKSEQDFKDSSNKEYQETLKNLDLVIAAEETSIRKRELSEEELQKALDDLEFRRLELRKTAAQDYVATTEDAANDIINIELDVEKKKDEIAGRTTKKEKSVLEQRVSEVQKYSDAVLEAASAVTDAIQARQDLELQMQIETLKKKGLSEEEFAKEEEALQAEYFEKNKSVQIAQTIISTLSSAVSAFASLVSIPVVGPALGAIAAGAALASGFYQVEQIKATTFNATSTKSSSTTTPQGSMYAEGGLLSGNTHDMGGIRTSMGELEGGEFVMNRRSTANFLPLLEAINSVGNTNGPELGNNQQPIIKTYVIANDVTTAQEANARINELARL